MRQFPTSYRLSVNLLVVCLFALAGPAILKAQGIKNGSFESPTIGTNTFQQTTPDSWIWDGLAGEIFNGTNGVPWPNPFQGKQFADIGTTYSLSQAFTIKESADYELSWSDATASSDTVKTSPYSVTVLNGGFDIISSSKFEAYRSSGGWLTRSVPVHLNAGTYLLRFQGIGVMHGLDTLIDNVALQSLPDDLITQISVSAVDVCWIGRTNQQYQLQFATNVVSTNWVNIGSPVAGTGTNCVTDTFNGSQKRFYRILRLP